MVRGKTIKLETKLLGRKNEALGEVIEGQGAFQIKGGPSEK